LSDEEFTWLGLKFCEAATRLGDGDDLNDAVMLQNTLSLQLVDDLACTVNPPQHDFDFEYGDAGAGTRVYQLATEIYEELMEELEEECTSEQEEA